jgi:DNA-binding IclR family transcriptional regulator
MSTTSSNRIRLDLEARPIAAVRPLSTAVKTLALLDHLGRHDRAARLSQLASDLGASRSTIYQRLVTLIEAGWVEQTEDARFQLTMRAMKIAGAAVEQAGLGDRTLPILRELVMQVGETASLAVIQDLAAVIIQRVEVGGVLQARAPLGTSMSLDDSASGRVLVAFADRDEMALLTQAGAKLPEEKVLRGVQRNGVGVAAEHIAVSAVAAPVFNHRQRCVAALSLVGPKGRFEVKGATAPALAAAGRLSIMLGGEPWSASHALSKRTGPEK